MLEAMATAMGSRTLAVHFRSAYLQEAGELLEFAAVLIGANAEW